VKIKEDFFKAINEEEESSFQINANLPAYRRGVPDFVFKFYLI
jgi:hypothetical protein